MAFIGNPGPLPSGRALDPIGDGGRSAPGSVARTSAALTTACTLILALISYFGDRDTFPGFALTLSGLATLVTAIAWVRSPRSRRRWAVAFAVLGLVPALTLFWVGA